MRGPFRPAGDLLILPEAPGPITLANLNWALPSILLLVIFVTIAWFTSVRNWFKGAHAQGSADELRAIETALGDGERELPSPQPT